MTRWSNRWKFVSKLVLLDHRQLAWKEDESYSGGEFGPLFDLHFKRFDEGNVTIWATVVAIDYHVMVKWYVDILANFDLLLFDWQKAVHFKLWSDTTSLFFCLLFHKIRKRNFTFLEPIEATPDVVSVSLCFRKRPILRLAEVNRVPLGFLKSPTTQ